MIPRGEAARGRVCLARVARPSGLVSANANLMAELMVKSGHSLEERVVRERNRYPSRTTTPEGGLHL